jgi:hypothetical protein
MNDAMRMNELMTEALLDLKAKIQAEHPRHKVHSLKDLHLVQEMIDADTERI